MGQGKARWSNAVNKTLAPEGSRSTPKAKRRVDSYHEIQNQILPLKTTQDSYNYGGHRSFSLI
jgi:hypothetical protein